MRATTALYLGVAAGVASPVVVQSQLSLVLLYTSDIKGNILPVHGNEAVCNLVPPPSNPAVTDCYGSNSQYCVVEYPSCAEDGSCDGCAGSMAGRVKYIETVKRSNANVLVVDVGNFFFGTQWYTQFTGLATNDYLKSSVFADDTDKTTEVMYDAMGVGPDEFAKGISGLAEAIKTGPIPRLLSNYAKPTDVVDSLSTCKTTTSMNCVLPFQMISKDGKDIAVFAMASMAMQEMAEFDNYSPIQMGDVVLAAQHTVADIKSQHPDTNVIVMLSFMKQYENEQVANMVPGIDVIVAKTFPTGATFPQVITQVEGGKVLIVGNRYRLGQSVGRLDLTFDDQGVITTESTADSGEIRLDVEYIPGTNEGTAESFDQYTWEITKIEAMTAADQSINVLGTTAAEVSGQSGNAQAFEYTCVSGQVPDTTPRCALDVGAGGNCCPDRSGIQGDGMCCPKESFWQIVGCQHSDCSLGYFVTNAMMLDCLDCDIALFNSGGIWGTLIGETVGNVTHISDLSVSNSFPLQDRMSTVKITASTLAQVMQHAVENYHPHYGHGKFLQVAGMRYAWDPEQAILLDLEVCTTWDRVVDACTGGVWEAIDMTSNKLYTLATVNFLRAGGDGYEILTATDKTAFEANDFGNTLQYVIQQYLRTHANVDVVSAQTIKDDCAGLKTDYKAVFDATATAGCRSLRSTGDSQYVCPASEGVALRVSRPEWLVIENGTNEECSGFGSCVPDLGYACSCKNALLDGFNYPQQYLIDRSAVAESCGDSDSKYYPGVAVARGSACQDIREHEPLGSTESLIVMLLGVLCVLVAVAMSAMLIKFSKHSVVSASQPIYLHIVCIGTAGTGLFCFLSAIPPTHFTCNAIPTVGAVSFCLVVTPLAVKTQLVLTVFGNKAMRAVKANKWKRIALIFAIAGVELLGCVVLSVAVPFMPSVVLLPTDVNPWAYSIVCLSQNEAGVNQDLLWTIPLVGFSAMLIFVSLVLAFQTRKVPDYFSDSKQVALGVYNIVIVGGTMLTMMFLIQGNPDVQLLVRVIAVSVSVISTVLILFVVKAHGIMTIDSSVKVGHLADMQSTTRTKGATNVTSTAVESGGSSFNANSGRKTSSQLPGSVQSSVAKG